jgi:Mg2+-importing ATPase
MPTQAYWSRTASDVMAELGTSLQGLSAAEAADRLREHGANTVADRDERTGLKLLLRQFASPLVLILVFGAVVSLFLRVWVDATIILAIVFGSTLLGFSQEYRASTALAELRRRLALTAIVVRDGTSHTVPASDIVPGDIIRLSAGNLVPADGLVLDARDFLVTEASLTGESFPVEKQPGLAPADAPLAARRNSVFLGTSVRSGTASVLVVHTGRDTAYGGIATRLRAEAPESEFARGVRQFGYLLVRVMIVLVVSVLVVNQALGRPPIESLLFAVALAVGLSPELLPAIISVTLSAGARAMARRGVIVRRLEAIENLGSMDVLCTDKTGTLTVGVIALSGAVDVDGLDSLEMRRLAFLNASFETGIENPLDAAIVTAGERDGLATAGYQKIDEIPYDFIRKRLTIVAVAADNPAKHLILTKGAFDTVIEVCTTLRRDGADAPLDDVERARLAAYYRQKGEEGFRVLAMAVKLVDAKPSYGHSDEQEMCCLGFLLFSDPPKKTIETTIAALAARGIRIRIVSGDNRYVTAHLAKTIGLDASAMLTGAELAKIKDEALWHLADRTDLFVEVDPQQKERIVRALRRAGNAVGYLGDGINDVPALHAADVGISVDQAVDVARESADVILLQPDLDVLRQGIDDGRRTFANTLKYICITTSANFGNMVSMALVTPFLPFLPLLPKQILLNNFLSDIPSLAISTDNVDAERLVYAQRWRLRDVQWFMVIFGLISSVFDFLTFGALVFVFAADEATFHTVWFVMSLLTELAVVLVLRTQKAALRSAPSRLLLWTTVLVVAAALVLPYSGPFASVFGFAPPPVHLVATVLLIVSAYIMVTELAKLRFFDYFNRTRRGQG